MVSNTNIKRGNKTRSRTHCIVDCIHAKDTSLEPYLRRHCLRGVILLQNKYECTRKLRWIVLCYRQINQKCALLYILQFAQICILHKEDALQSVTLFTGSYSSFGQILHLVTQWSYSAYGQTLNLVTLWIWSHSDFGHILHIVSLLATTIIFLNFNFVKTRENFN